MNWRERWGLVFGATLILWSVSERAFWSVFQNGDNVLWIAVSILPYLVVTYVSFLAVQYFRVSSVWGLVLIGALYGWLIEGVYAMTLFGAPGIPFPITISWTALAWHMLLSVMAMLWFHHRALTQSFAQSVLYAMGFALLWGVWSMLWFFETPPVTNSIPLFAAHITIVVALMAIGHALLGRRSVVAFNPPRREWIPLASLPILYFLVPVLYIGFAAAVLPVLFGILYILLARSRKRHAAPLVLPVLTTHVPKKNLATLALVPIVTTIFYALMSTGIIPPYPVSMPGFIVTSAIGALVFLVACVKVWRSA